MKRISVLPVIFFLSICGVSQAEDAATEEKLNQLSGRIEDLVNGLEMQKKRLSEMSREIDGLRDHQNRPGPSYASQEDLKRLAEKLQEVEKNREHDKEVILKEIAKIGKAVAATPSPPPRLSRNSSSDLTDTKPSRGDKLEKPDKTEKSEKVAEYTIKSGDNLSLICQAYKEQGIKITPEQIVKANPGLNPKGLKINQKIFIPLP
jgi:LysM repeat protein